MVSYVLCTLKVFNSSPTALLFWKRGCLGWPSRLLVEHELAGQLDRWPNTCWQLLISQCLNTSSATLKMTIHWGTGWHDKWQSLDTETLKILRVGPTKISWGSVSSSRKFYCGVESPNTLVQAGQMNSDFSIKDLAVTVDAGMNMSQLTASKTNHRRGCIWSVENRSKEAVTPSTWCWWCHVWNTGLPFVSTFGYVEKPERVQ